MNNFLPYFLISFGWESVMTDMSANQTSSNPTLANTLSLNVPDYVTHQGVIDFVKKIATLTKPERSEWCDGSEAEDQR